MALLPTSYVGFSEDFNALGTSPELEWFISPCESDSFSVSLLLDSVFALLLFSKPCSSLFPEQADKVISEITAIITTNIFLSFITKILSFYNLDYLFNIKQNCPIYFLY